MGWILSKLWRKKKSTMEELEQLEGKLEELSKLRTDTAVRQKKVLGSLVTYSIVFYILAAAIVYFKFFPEARTRNEKILILLPFLVVPVLIFLLRKVLTWWYHRKVGKGDQQLSKLREQKAKILDEVMEKETYKVAKQILDKFAPSKLVSPPRGPLAAVAMQGGKGGSEIRRRPGTGPPSRLNSSLPSSGPPVSRPGQVPPGSPSLALPKAGFPPTGSPAPPPVSDRPGPPLPPVIRPPGLGRGAPGPPLPRPVLPRERGYLDQFVEYLVGDGPSNRFALICRQCQSHNGMALREEFEYIAYRCCYCYYWNPARKQRPVAPRLPDPTMSAAMSSAVSSSDSSDQSGTESQTQSRRSSVDMQGEVRRELKHALGEENVGTDAVAEVTDEERSDTKGEEVESIEVKDEIEVCFNPEEIVAPEENIDNEREEKQEKQYDTEMHESDSMSGRITLPSSANVSDEDDKEVIKSNDSEKPVADAAEHTDQLESVAAEVSVYEDPMDIDS